MSRHAVTPYGASLNIGADGSTSAHVHDLMGCSTLASSRERALMKLESAIPEYYRWLRSKGEKVQLIRRPKITVLEEIETRSSAGKAGGPDPLFSCDRKSCTRQDILRCLQLLTYTRTDLDELLAKIPAKALDWTPRSEPRSIRNALEHIANVDIWYLSRIRADPPLERRSMRDVFRFLVYARSLVKETLPTLTRDQRSKIFYSRKWSNAPWPWTATKVLHRLVSHERQHTRYLQRIMSLRNSLVHKSN